MLMTHYTNRLIVIAKRYRFQKSNQGEIESVSDFVVMLKKLAITCELIQLMQMQKLRYFGHLIRHDSLQRDLLEGMVEGKKGRGRPRTHWSKNVEGWLEMKFFECKRKAES